jgi:hypothetical protein
VTTAPTIPVAVANSEDVRALNDVSHEQEQGNRDQHIVIHHAEGVLREEVKNVVVKNALAWHVIGVGAKHDAHRHQRECDRETEENKNNKQPQHDQGNNGIAHDARPSSLLPNCC